MLEHSAMYLNMPPPYEDDASFFPDFYSRLGPCELQDPVWAKMSALAAGVNKKRKKSETKPQAQINKCNNEKRRREQENIYIEELAELISANFADMSSLSVKPDKCAILQETVNQIRSIKARESQEQNNDPVQQGEVSSSRPSILSNEVYGPLLLEALEGFLFVVSAEGKVEHVTDNVTTYIKFTKDEVLGKSIYNFIHHGDHARFSACLLPMSIGWAQEPTNRSRSFSIRFLVKSPEDQDESVEEKQQRVSCYELMQISSTLLRDQVSVGEEDGECGPCLLCVASRISHRDKAASGIEQFTTKLDTTGRIIGVDTSSVSPVYSHYINKDLMDQVLRDLVPPQDLHKLNTHLRETLTSGQSTSAVYRLQLAQDKYVQVQTKSKLFKTNPHSPNDTDFIMATHSIIGENDAIGPTDPGGGTLVNNNNNTSTPSSNSGGASGVGGPLMTSVVNGARNGSAPVSSGSESSTASSNHNLLNASSTPSFTTTFNLDNDFNFDIFPQTTWDQLDSGAWATDARPPSRHSVTPVSTPTPRPPSNPAQSPLAAVGALTPFSPMHPLEEQKDTKANVLEEASAMMDSVKLRNLLTKPPNSVVIDNSGDSDSRNRNKILKGLLNQQDEDDMRSDNRSSPRGAGLMGRPQGPMQGSSELPHKNAAATAAASSSSSTSGNNNMLRQLLNDTSDDDDHETRAPGMKSKSELLQQLLKSENKDNEGEDKKNEAPSQEDSLLRSLGFSNSPSPPEESRGRKRPSDDRDDGPHKRSSTDGAQVSSSGQSTGGSKLCERNKMLASLLAKQPNTNQRIPPIPPSVISAIPQEKLPRPVDSNMNKNRTMLNQTMQQQQHLLNSSRVSTAGARMSVRPSHQTNYLNAMLTAGSAMQRSEHFQMQTNSMSYASVATSTTDNTMWGNNNNINSNQEPSLSDILDDVIKLFPDEQLCATLNLSNVTPQSNMNEKAAITLIQNSLMQCEMAVKSPSSPSTPMPNTPPAYPITITTQNNQGVSSFPPPPNYPQGGFTMKPRVQVTPGAPSYSGATVTQQQQILHQKRLIQQQEQKRRLLQLQQQQHIMVPNRAATEMNSGLQGIDSLLNTTVAPNVTVKRTTGVPESQLSPGYGGQLGQSNRVSVSNQQPYSPHSQLTSPIGQQAAFPTQTTVSSFQQAAARLSPQGVYNQQLSPRQAYSQGQLNQSQNWQQTQARLSVQNPMLNAQLTGAYMTSAHNGRAFQRAAGGVVQAVPAGPQRQMSSPSGQVSVGFTGADQQQFPPASPNQYLRLQRTNSVPQATTQLPGGLGSPRPYVGSRDHPSQHPPHMTPPHHTPYTMPPHPMMYQQESVPSPQQQQYCTYDQTASQMHSSYHNGSGAMVDRGGRGPPPHLQPGVTGGSGGGNGGGGGTSSGGGNGNGAVVVHAGSSASGPTSEYVRQELRAVVGARTQQTQGGAQGSAQQMAANRTAAQLLAQQSAADLESLGLSFEMTTSGASESPKLWGAMGSEMGSMSPQPATSRSTMEDPRPGDHKASLLQKLLSE